MTDAPIMVPGHVLVRAETVIMAQRHDFKTLDEVSVLFSDEATLMRFVEEAKSLGWNHFNSERDVMHREDEDETFGVAFEFLKKPDTDWRIEAMAVLNGTAPLHSAALEKLGEGCVIHLSFKHSKPDYYAAYFEETVLENLRGKPGVILGNPEKFQAAYRNSYGRFSYWGDFPPYLKPRINLRDQ